MKKLTIIAIIIIILNMMDVIACDYEMVRKQDVVSGRYIGNMFFKSSDDGIIQYSANGEIYAETEPAVNSDYSIYYNNGIYLFIDESKDSYPENKLYGGVRKNSPMYFFDKNMSLNQKAEYDGYFDFRQRTEDGFYFSFIDTSSYKYDESINRYTGEKITRYYKSDGMTMNEISYEEFDSVETADDKVYDLCNGTQYYYENDKLWLKVYDENVAVEREDKISSYMISDNSYNGLISYKKLYGADGKVKEQAVSYDMITYIDLPIDADVTSVYCDNQYLYCKIIRNDENLYRIALSVFYDKVKVKYNNTYLSFVTPPTTENDRTLVPMRFLFEQMGAEVEWEEETQTAVVTKGEDVISFSIDNNNASVNGEIKSMDVPARLINDKTMIPVRFLSEELGCTVEWDEDAKMVIITD